MLAAASMAALFVAFAVVRGGGRPALVPTWLGGSS